jgi:hypothetical protein
MTEGQRWILISVGVGLLAFGLGAGWQYTRASDFQAELDASSRDLKFQRLQGALAAATIEAQRGRHERARQMASSFFSGLQEAIEEAPPSASQAFREILSQRDAMITSLSRSDPEAAPLLGQLFTRYRIGLGEQAGPESVSPAPTPTPTPPRAPGSDTTDTAR